MTSRFADLVFAGACVILVGVVIADRMGPQSTAPAAHEGLVAGSGPALEPIEEGVRLTLALYLNPSCQFCSESMPFYRRLAETAASRPEIRVVFPVLGDEERFKAYLSENGLDPAWARRFPLLTGVTGTPTMVALRPDGAVSRSWIGRLSEEQERDVLALLQ